jgi:hypothetical protein
LCFRRKRFGRTCSSQAASASPSFGACSATSPRRATREAAEQLREERDLATIKKSYHEIDRKLSVLEEYLGEAVSAYDREINLQTTSRAESRAAASPGRGRMRRTVSDLRHEMASREPQDGSGGYPSLGRSDGLKKGRFAGESR